MKILCWRNALSCAAVMTISVVALAENHNGANNGNYEKSKVLKVALWGDEFYNSDPDTRQAMIDQTIESMNAHHLDFTIFAGDTKNGSSECSDTAIGFEPMQIFNSLDVPTLYTVGDNEWVDCHRTNNANPNGDPYDPLERLSYLRATFFSQPYSQGSKHPIPVERQGGFVYSENSRFVSSGVEFVALHIPGSNNNLVTTDGECFKKSNRTWDDCDAATAEYQARNVANLEWLHSSFDKARARDLAGIVISIQADIFFPFELSDGGYQEDFWPQLDPAYNGYADFFHALVNETQSFSGQVLLVHGDSHYFKLDKPMINDVDTDGRLTPNFTRVEVFGSEDNSWVEMTVDPSSENVFSFVPVFLQ